MKGLFFEGKARASVKDTPRPDCLPGTVILEIEAAGICGSDLHMYAGRWGTPPDTVVGHEISGKVVEVGQAVKGIAVGDRVCVECFKHCGECDRCRAGLYNLCENREFTGGVITGGFAEYARHDAASVFKMPPGASVEQTVVVEPAAVACRAAARSEAAAGDFAVVIGGGSIGLLCAAVLRARMTPKCLIAVKYDHQADLARKLGIDHVHKVTEGKTSDAVKELTGGKMADAVIDTVGSTVAIADAAECVRPAGRICLLASPGGRTMIPLGPIVGNEIRLTGSFCYGFSNGTKDFDSAIDMITSGALPAEEIITHRFPLDQAAEAFRTAADKKTGSVKVIIEMKE